MGIGLLQEDITILAESIKYLMSFRSFWKILLKKQNSVKAIER
jgi:hypothetical protein